MCNRIPDAEKEFPLCIVIVIKSSLRENKITTRKINKRARVVVQCFCVGGTWFGILPPSLASIKDLTKEKDKKVLALLLLLE